MDFSVKVDVGRSLGNGTGESIYRIAASSPECEQALRSICARKAAQAREAAGAAAHSPMGEGFASDVHTGVPGALTVGVVFPTFKGADNVNKAHGVLHW